MSESQDAASESMYWDRHAPAELRPFDPRSLTDDGSLPRLWSRTWAAAPSRPLIHAAGHGWVTAGEFEERTRRRAGSLAALGVGAGDRVLFSHESSLSLVEWHVAVLRLGAVAVPTNPGYRDAELAHIVADADPKAAIVDAADRAGWVRKAGPSVAVIEPDTALAPADVDLDGATVDDPALLPYTSGTTGVPKGALLSHGNILSSALALVTAWRWTAADRLVLALPLFHMHGLGVGLHGTLATGASAVLQRTFDPDAVLTAIDEHSATMFFGVPTMYHRLAQSSHAGELAKLRLCVAGSAPLAPELFHAIERLSGQRVLERYGMTETVMNLSNPHDGERRPGTVGFELPGVHVRLSDGDSGEIELRGPNVFAGYWRRPDATAESFTTAGWFQSGDLAERDADGYVRIVGRSKELIISGGYNVYPREIEDALLELAGVREAAVVGQPSAEWGEVVTAFIVRGDGALTADDVTAFCSNRFVSYKRPRRVHFVDALPRNAMGKIVRSELTNW